MAGRSPQPATGNRHRYRLGLGPGPGLGLGQGARAGGSGSAGRHVHDLVEGAEGPPGELVLTEPGDVVVPVLGRDAVARVVDDPRASAHDVPARLLYDADRVHGPHHPCPAEIRRTFHWLVRVRG